MLTYLTIGGCTALFHHALVRARHHRPSTCTPCRNHTRLMNRPIPATATLIAFTLIWPPALPLLAIMALHECPPEGLP